MKSLHSVGPWMCVLLCVVAMKQYYSTASADQLYWILLPTAMLVTWLTGIPFQFESGAGFLSRSQLVLITPVCAGVNFLITVFLMVSVLWLLQSRKWYFIALALPVAFVSAVIANAIRITLSIYLHEAHDFYGWFNAARVHRVDGIVVYFLILLLIYTCFSKQRTLWIPLAIYYFVSLLLPLANGAYNQDGFWEHALFVLLLPPLIVLAFKILAKLAKYGELCERFRITARVR